MVYAPTWNSGSSDYTGVVEDTNKVLSKDATKEYSFVKSALDKKATGVMLDATSSYLVNFENGAITGKKPTDCVVHCVDDGKWYKIGTDGKVDKTAGLAANTYGLWMIEGTNGSVDFDYEDYILYFGLLKL